MKLTQMVALLVMSSSGAYAANILALLMIPSPSHHIWNRSLMFALAARGHNVTVLTPDAEKNPPPNYTQYVVPEAYDYEMDIMDTESDSPFDFVDTLFAWDVAVCRKMLSSAGTRRLLELAGRNTASFDLVIADVTGADCQLGFVHAFGGPPLVGVTAYSQPLWASYMTGDPHNPAYVPELTSPFGGRPMGFSQRLYNTLLHLYSLFKAVTSYEPRVDGMVRELFGEGVPPVRDIKNNASLVLVNTIVGFDPPRPHLPAVVEVGGMHIGPNKTLPQDLAKLMDEAKEGFVFFSLGSNVRSDAMPADRRQVFLDAFSRLPHKVLWKWESDALPGQPDNVVVSKWLPQSDILAHPNILLFISHNGLLSTQEAIHRGVPMVGVPFMADQDINCAKSVAHGFAERIDYATVTADQVLQTIKKVIYDPRYRENARRLSQLTKDQPQTPLERAVFWTEYVIRHKGAPHLRCASADLPWYKYLLLDVACVLTAGALALLLVLYRTWLVVASLARRFGRPACKQKTG